MKTFFVGVWLEGGEGKKLVGPRCFLPGLLKCFLSKIERKLSERNLIGKWRKCPCANAHGLVQFVAFFFSSFFCLGRCLLLFFFFCFFFWFLGHLHFFFFCFLLWFFFFKHDFFSRWFLFPNKFERLLFFFFFFFFLCFNRASSYNKDIWVNLYKHIFFIPPLFHSQPIKNEGN